MIDIKRAVPLKELTTFKIGGPAAYYVAVTNEQTLQKALAWACEKKLPFFMLGGGSNVLVDDTGFNGLVAHVTMNRCSIDAPIMSIEAGCVLKDCIEEAAMAGLGGWEKLAGIPGSVGGAVRGNAGAFGTEIKDVIHEVVAIHTCSYERRVFTLAECDFGYRHSFFKVNPEWVIVSATVQLRPTEPEAGRAVILETVAEREKRHLQSVRTAGSFFMNPIAPEHVVKYFELDKQTTAREHRVPAGWLIEKVGMKGARVGGAIASQQHPNYLVNETGDATAADIVALAEQIKAAVHKEFGIELHEEISIV